MDKLTQMTQAMPPETPLAMPEQSFARGFRDGGAPGVATGQGARGWRWITFGPAALATAALIAIFTDLFQMDGLSGVEIALVSLIAFTFFWISLTLSTALAGVARVMRAAQRPTPSGPIEPQSVALLMPIYNEVPACVFGNALAMVDALSTGQSPHHYTLFVLSDTTDAAIAQAELRAFYALRARAPDGVAIHYRRRAQNTDRKVGNLADWIVRWGGGFGAMLVLDADSLMSAEAIHRLSDELARDPTAGLIQSAPRLFGAETLFGRVQQFSNHVYGGPLAEGLAAWSDQEGNYWGHNAIIRTAAFAASAGLPKLAGFRDRRALVLSHDFVEACLLRRAGWAVRLIPDIAGSYEESPPTLIDYIQRDRRWCQGNLQHLRILASRGFHSISRFHLLHGAIGYLLSPLWLILLTIWAALGLSEAQNPIVYFSGLDPRPNWPDVSEITGFAVLMAMYGVLLAPKLLGALMMLHSGAVPRDLGGPVRFGLNLVTEIILSVAYAPIMMVQQTLAVLRSVIGIRDRWRPQRQGVRAFGLLTLIRTHIVETLIGVALMTGIGLAIISPWLLPIAISLTLAVPLSALSGLRLSDWRRAAWILGSGDAFHAPEIIATAKAHRRDLLAALAETDQIAAE